MEKYLSASFVLLYEKYFAKKHASKLIGEKDKIVDAIFHEREFIEWLRKKYNEKLNKESYQKLSTANNLTKYINDYNNIKDKSIEFEKKEIIHEQLLSEKLLPVYKYEYDLDIVEAYFKTKEQIDSFEPPQKLKNKELFLKSFLYAISEYCKNNELPFRTVLEIRYPIIVDSSMINFETYLGRTIIAFDINKIESLLSYQNTKWNREEFFASIVEHGVYNYVKNNSPFDNNLRLSKIMNWVERNRIFLPQQLVNNQINSAEIFKTDIINQDITKDTLKNLNRIKSKKVNKTQTKTVKEKKLKNDLLIQSQGDFDCSAKDLMLFHYWPYGEEKLKELYNGLVNNTKVNKNVLFTESFRKYDDFPKNGTEWIAALNQLMFLLYLIYNKKKQFNSVALHNIALKLFKSNNQSFSAKALNTTFNKLALDLSGNKKLSPGLQSIQDIFDRLQITKINIS